MVVREKEAREIVKVWREQGKGISSPYALYSHISNEKYTEAKGLLEGLEQRRKEKQLDDKPPPFMPPKKTFTLELVNKSELEKERQNLVRLAELIEEIIDNFPDDYITPEKRKEIKEALASRDRKK